MNLGGKISTEYCKLKCPQCGKLQEHFILEQGLLGEMLWRCLECDKVSTGKEMIDFNEPETEAVEWCPYCENENVYPDWDVKRDGYVAKCQECGEEILLCDECLHAEDNLRRRCNRREFEGKTVCFRKDKASWVHLKDDDGGIYYICSACCHGFKTTNKYKIEEMNYCPHCGVRMEGVNEKESLERNMQD